MSRSGYSDDCGGWDLIRWRGAVKSAIRGKRGQAFLIEMRDALNALPVRELIEHELESNGQVCAIGSVGLARGIDMSGIDVEYPSEVAAAFGIARAMAAEIEDANDGHWRPETPAERFDRMLAWVEYRIK